MIRALLLGLMTVASSAAAQTSYPPAPQTWVAQQLVTLDANGDATWVFDPAARPMVVPAVVHLPKAIDMANPVICNFTAISTVSVSVHCWRTQLNGLLSGLLSGTVTGAQVNLVARAIP